ncbi:SDR family NAD(P)-dependent oxidoreductase, partial [Streptomyces sp. TRM76130]|nr:SDR family NAD(P)-dependent oxidoreductase [Streptomyces sp. TRM76130]
MDHQHATTALITGGTSGIGLATAHELASRGLRVFLCARDGDRVTATVAKLRSEGFDVAGTACDVRSADDIARTVEEASAFGELGVLVNNAGRSGGGVTAQIADDLWHAVLETNLTSVFRMTKAVLN